MKSFKRTAATIAAALIGVAAALIPTTAALADTDPAAPAVTPMPDSCGAALICGYVNTSWRTDQGYELNPVDPAGTCVVVFYRNAWSGVWNASGHTIRLFKNTGCTGTDYKAIPNGTGKYQFSVQLGITWDNSVDAYRII